VYLQLSQILKLPVITRSAGKSLGNVMNMWVDPARREIVSLDLEDKKSGTAPRIANIPLKSLRQIGDVILVQDETAMYGSDLDSRYGFVYLTGLEVRTRSGKVLGKVDTPQLGVQLVTRCGSCVLRGPSVRVALCSRPFTYVVACCTYTKTCFLNPFFTQPLAPICCSSTAAQYRASRASHALLQPICTAKVASSHLFPIDTSLEWNDMQHLFCCAHETG
jgi:sporulation protein YlmC with PRC-barrel domain